MRIYFGTNRNPDNVAAPTTFGAHFSQNGLTDLRFGWADFAPGSTKKYTLSVAPEQMIVDPAKAAVGDLSGQVLGSEQVFDMVRAEMKSGGCDCVISIHGFDYNFEEALTRTAELKNFYGDRPMVWFLFTWPSDGSLLPFKAYASDRDDARASGVALGRGILKLCSFLHGTRPEDYCGQSLHVVAHSMGNFALRWAVQAIKSQSLMRRLIDETLLFAADEDDDAFELDYKLQPLVDLARRVTVYCNTEDKALVVSDVTKNNPDRLGASGPRNSRALPDKVSVVRVEPVLKFADDPTGHQYYRGNARVRDDALAVFRGTGSVDIKNRDYLPETRTYRLVKPRRGG
ncbi:MAG: hypothetical protein NVS9B10_13250 [Nevskia sp.]